MKFSRYLLPSFMSLAMITLFANGSYANEKLFYQIITGSDDAEEALNDPDALNEVDLTSSDLELGKEKEKSTSQQLVGLRFQNIKLQPGTKIVKAYLQFTTDETKNYNPFQVSIRAEASDNAQTFTEATGNLSNRATSAAMVDWSAAPEWQQQHERNTAQQSPNIASLIQEVINREGWQSGNAISFLIAGDGTRTAESFEGSESHTGLNDYAAQLVIEVPSTLQARISASDDDAEENLPTGAMDVGSSDLELGWESEKAGDAQAIGLRFANLAIPQGAQILSASIQFAQDEDKNNNPFEVTIYGEDSANAKVFTAEDKNISNRSKTAAKVSWSTSDWLNKHEAEAAQRTPDLTAIVQAIVDKTNWEEGNSLGFIIEGKGTRTAESFDGTSSLAPMLVVRFIGELKSPSVDRIRLSWNRDPATTMTVLWNQLRGNNARVHYAPYDGKSCSTDLASYTDSQQPQRITVAYDMNTTVARLSGLEPDSAYRFMITDSENKSACYWFRTAPNTAKAFTYITGGDTKSSGNALQAGRWSNQLVAKLRPLFVLFTGDFNSGNGTNAASWKQWLYDWSTLTVSEDGRMYPIIAVHGNHEDGDFEVLYKLFDSGNQDNAQDNNYAYYALSFGGDLLRLYNLNSQLWKNGKQAAHQQQTTWFAQDLMTHQNTQFKVAGYHKPMRPHTRSKSENDYLVNDWAPLFEQYGINIAYESDTHNHVYTFPIRLAKEGESDDMGFVRDDAKGVLHVGEGSWGATPRDNNDDKSWTLDSASLNQVKLNHIYPATATEAARIDIRAIQSAAYINGEFINYVADAGANTEADLFAIPKGATVREVPFYGDHISYPFKAVSGNAPAAPSNMNGEAISYFDINVNWINNAEPKLVRNIQLERRMGENGDWIQLSGNIDATTNEYQDSNLNDGTDYFYRVRATNIFGASSWSNAVKVSTPVDTRLKAEFQQGISDYSGNTVIAIASASPDQSFSEEALSVDQATSDFGGPGTSQGLIAFKDLFNSLSGVPQGAQIESAKLRVFTSGSSKGPIRLHRMLKAWDTQSASWNGFVNGIQNDGIEALEQADDSQANASGGQFLYFDVTPALKAWAAGADNYGWAMINASTDGWDLLTEIYSGPQERRPLLRVFYNTSMKGDVDGNGQLDKQDLLAIRQYLRQPASACTACDVNDDGQINILDMRLLVLKMQQAD